MNGLQMPKIESMSKMQFSKWLMALGLCLTIGTGSLSAGYEYKMDARTQPMGQLESEISAKFTRGVVNVLYGWTEIARTPINMAQGPKKNFLKVIFVGIPYGVLRAAGRTVLGVFEIVTCYAPQKPIMEPIEGDVV
jgi:putative exosortase-associated protein (TIGR04073 family)